MTFSSLQLAWQALTRQIVFLTVWLTTSNCLCFLYSLYPLKKFSKANIVRFILYQWIRIPHWVFSRLASSICSFILETKYTLHMELAYTSFQPISQLVVDLSVGQWSGSVNAQGRIASTAGQLQHWPIQPILKPITTYELWYLTVTTMYKSIQIYSVTVP